MTSSRSLAFSSVTGPCEGNSLVSLRPARASGGVRLKEVCLPSKDRPPEVSAGADVRLCLVSALFSVTVRGGGEGPAEVWKCYSSETVSHRVERKRSQWKHDAWKVIRTVQFKKRGIQPQQSLLWSGRTQRLESDYAERGCCHTSDWPGTLQCSGACSH